jgi:hypothetical protein
VEREKFDQARLVPFTHLTEHPADRLPDQIVFVPKEQA